MPDIGKAYVQIVPTTRGIASAVESELNGQMGNAGQSAGKSFGSNLLKTLGGLGIGVAVGKFLKDSLEAGGALQQSFGGLETLYGDAADAAKSYAMEAAKAGISANDYAEQAVSFGASLKAAFSGDTTKAVEAANTAIMDMADNSAKMGTDISAIQSAYQGFAKQNYTMLDNLKLGYGGTKTEMERLLADAQKISGVKYDISNLGDVYEAIHVIQTDLGLTGVAAQEAADTFSGSFAAVKASITNVMAGLSLGQDIGPAMSQLAESVGAFIGNNLIPMIGNMLNGIPDLVLGAFSMLTENADSIINTGIELITSLIEGFYGSMPAIAAAMVELGTAAWNALKDIPWLDLGMQLITAIGTGIGNSLDIIGGAAIKVGGKLLEEIGKFVSKMVDAGKDLLLGLKDGIVGAISNVVQAAKDAGRAIVDGIKGFFGIASPSKLMAEEVGRFIPAGIAMGIEQNLGVLESAMTDMSVSGLTRSMYRPGEQVSGTDDLLRILDDRNQNVTVNVTLQGDASQIFRVVRQENQKFRGSTGRSAFAY